MTPQPTADEVSLDITGMTCASCSARIEKKLNRLEGVQASVNLPLELATVHVSGTASLEEVLATVRALGYGATVHTPRPIRSEPTPDVEARADPTSRTDAGHGGEPAAHTGARQGDLPRRALVALVLTVPVVVLAMTPGLDLGDGGWVQWALTTPVVLWAGWPFHRAAVLNARHLASTMDTLVSIGVLSAYLWSTYALVAGLASPGSGMTGMTDMSGMDATSMSGATTTMSAAPAHLYFETAAVVTTFLLIGRWLEARAKNQGRSALTSLLTLAAKDATRLTLSPSGAYVEDRVPIDDLRVGDVFVVRPGERIATDGQVIHGDSSVDAALVTGESEPVTVAPGSPVTGGTVNGAGLLTIEATRVGAQTMLAEIGRLVAAAQTGKAPVQRLADRVSAVFVPVVLVLAMATFLGWWWVSGQASTALGIAISVLVIACPCALGLATPTAILVGTGRGAQMGILIKGPAVLEDTRRIDTVVFDKTGTITTGHPHVVALHTSEDTTDDEALALAAAVEWGSEHPAATAILAHARSRDLSIPNARDFRAVPGQGARAWVNDVEVLVGQRSLFASSALQEALPKGALLLPEATTAVWVGWGGTAHAVFAVADTPRPEAVRVIDNLQRRGLTTYLLSGDRDSVTTAVAAEVGIDGRRTFASVAPADKHAVIAQLQSQGRVVAMVGDGVNDAAALAQADLGIAMGSGTAVAADSADLLLLRADLASVPAALDLSQATLRVIRQNLGWAFGYNLAALPLAMAGLLNPMIAGGAMALSSVLVVTNSLRLRRFTPR